MSMRSLSFIFCSLCFAASFKEYEAVDLIEHNANRTATTSSTTSAEIGSLTLAKIIGSIVASFVAILILQWIIKRYRCKRATTERASNNERNTTTIELEGIRTGSIHVTIPETLASPPSYREIHQYQTVNSTSLSPVYYNMPGMKNYYGILLKPNKLPENSVQEENPPPPYVQGSEEEEEGSDENVVHLELVLHSNNSNNFTT